MNKKRILIISQVFHPYISPRSFRATELAKELARQGNDVTVYTVLGKYDYARYEQEHKIKIKNIGRMLFGPLKNFVMGQKSILDFILEKMFRRLLEFPDIELMFKIPRILKTEKNIDLLISIAIPYPIHWGCALAKSMYKESFPGTWAADCGDPYMGNKVAKKPFFYFKYVEKWFCRKTDYIVVPIAGAIGAYYPEFHKKIKVIPQGFRFDSINLALNKTNNKVPTFAYAGSLYKRVRDPSMFLAYLANLDSEFKFILYTSSRDLITPFCKKLGAKIEIRNNIPRDQLLSVLSQMDFLVNFEKL